MEDARSERAARWARRLVLQLHSSSETELIDVTQADPIVNPKPSWLILI